MEIQKNSHLRLLTERIPSSHDELESVVIGTNEGLTANDGTSGYTYSNGTLTIGSGVTIDGNIVIIASAKPKSNDASLKSLTYSIASMSITDQAIELQSETYTYTVELNQFVANATAISLTPTVTATGLANVTANLGVASYSGLTAMLPLLLQPGKRNNTRLYHHIYIKRQA